MSVQYVQDLFYHMPERYNVLFILISIIWNVLVLILKTSVKLNWTDLHGTAVICITKIFPFDHIEHDQLFISEVNSLDLKLETIKALSAKLFNPFEINNDEIYYPLCDIDPDAHYFNELNAHISQNCNYYYEHSFSSVIQNRFTSIIDLKVFSLCYINIRSQKS